MKMFIAAIMILASIMKVESKQSVVIGVMLPSEADDKYCFQSAMKAAMDLINKDDSILKNYELVLKFQRTLNKAMSLRQYFDFARQQAEMHVLLGPAYSSYMFGIAQLATMDYIPQISYSALDNFEYLRKEGVAAFPYVIRTTPMSPFFTLAYVSIIQHFKWKRVSIIYEPELYFDRSRQLSIELEKVGITILSTTPYGYDYIDKTQKVEALIDTLVALDARIIVLMMPQDNLQRLFCHMYHRQMYGPKYQFILGHGTPKDWYLSSPIPTQRWLAERNCSKDVLLTVADGFIEPGRSPLSNKNGPTIAGLTPSEGWSLIKQYKDIVWKAKQKPLEVNKETPEDEYFLESTFGFDSVYLAALTLNKSLPANGTNLKPNYTKETATNFKNLMLEADFEGLTGHVVYDKQIGERYTSLLLLQFKADKEFDYPTQKFNITKGKSVNIAKFNPQNRKLDFFQDPLGLSLFQNRQIPLDGVYKTKIITSYSYPLVGTMWALACVGIFMSLALLFLNIVYRKEKMIKMSSPNINNGIILGCIISYVAIFVYGLDGNFLEQSELKYSCGAFVLLISVGFTLSFGCLFSKTWRIYKIFTASKTLNRVKIQDHRLFGTVFILLLIDAFVFVIWMIISPFRVEATMYKNEKSYDEVKEYLYLHCDCKHRLPFTITMFVYKGCLLMFGLFLAWETKKVKVAVLNDSKMIGMAIYNVSAIASLGAIGAFAMYPTHFYAAGYIVVTMTVVLTTTVTLLLVFLPKVRILFSKSYLARSRAASTISFGPSKPLGNCLSTLSTVNQSSSKSENHSCQNRSFTSRHSLAQQNSN